MNHKQQREFDSKTLDLNQQHEKDNEYLKMELQDLKEQKREDELEMDRMKKELTNAEQFLSFYESTIRQNNCGITEQYQVLNKMNLQHEEMTAMINRQRQMNKHHEEMMNKLKTEQQQELTEMNGKINKLMEFIDDQKMEQKKMDKKKTE